MKAKTNKDLLKQIKAGLRLTTKPPKTETPKNVYTRKVKHKKGRYTDDTSFFYGQAKMQLLENTFFKTLFDFSITHIV
jgi:hypothetical protein